MTALALLFTLSAIGISETVYLIRKRIASQNPACLIGSECTVVLTSKYNRLLIIPNDILGLLSYSVISLLAAFLVIGVGPVWFWGLSFKILITIASLVSIVFTFIQWRVIHAWCFWCLASAFTIWLMAIIILVSNAV